MDGLLLPVFNGLSHASTLFIMASGLTLMFGVTRMVNFAHGSFYMLGALFGAHAVTLWWPGAAVTAWAYGAVMLSSALVAGAVGAAAYVLLLSRMQEREQLYQLVATFGLSLFLHDAMRAGFGPQEVFAPRFPGLQGAVQWGESFLPLWSCFLLLAGPLVWFLLHVLLTKSRWGKLVRAATQDPQMLQALGVPSGRLMLSVVALSCALAGLAGALQLPKEPAHLQMDIHMVVETFVVVVTGGLGSISGAFWAAVLIGLVHALGLSIWPEASLVLVFLTMAVVLIVRPQGLGGGAQPPEEHHPAPRFVLLPPVFAQTSPMPPRPASWAPWFNGGLWLTLSLAGAALLAQIVWGSDYSREIIADALIYVLLGLSLQWVMGLAGWVSFGHAAFFGLGAYAAAWAWNAGWTSIAWAILSGAAAATLLALVFGAALIRMHGVYLAMLSLALAQSLWALAVQWVPVTGGDNGLIGLGWLKAGDKMGWALGLLLCVVLWLWGMARGVRSSFGSALQAARDAPERALASGLPVSLLRYGAFVMAAAGAGVAGSLWAIHKGAVFPSVLSVATSVDALLVVLLGGIHQLLGTLVGAAMLTWGAAELGRSFDLWKGVLGLIIMLVMVLAPDGVLSALRRQFSRVRR
jgi:branched-chain amino acid transport system permease protein